MYDSESLDDRRPADELFSVLHDVWRDLTAEGAPFEVESVEVSGRRVRAYRHAARSLAHVWAGAAERHDDKEAFVFETERWTYGQANAQIAAVSAWFHAQGIRPGDRIAIAMRNYPEWMLAFWAAVSNGLVVAGFNAWWTGPELVHAVENAEPKVLICDEERFDLWRPYCEQFPNVEVVLVRDRTIGQGVTHWSDLLSLEGQPAVAPIDPDSDACIFYTSGTTGKPKGARLSHRGCTNNLMSQAFWAAAHRETAKRLGQLATGESTPPPNPVTLLATTPLFHVTANNSIAQYAASLGAKLVLMRKWEPLEALKLIERERVTGLSGVPVIVRELVMHPEFGRHDTRSLVSLSGSGAAVTPDVVDKIDRETHGFPRTGYGLTESCGIISSNVGPFFVAKPKSVGPAMPDYEVRCVDLEGKDVGQNEIGELWVRGAQVFRGYLKERRATLNAFSDGWFRTGDLVRIDEDGFIFVVDRAKDIVIRGGENIYSSEVESALYAIPGVRECAVFAVPDDRLGEEVGAVIVRAGDSRLTDEAIRSQCERQIAQHKIPRHIWIREDCLPRNANGKVLKGQLRLDYVATRCAANG